MNGKTFYIVAAFSFFPSIFCETSLLCELWKNSNKSEFSRARIEDSFTLLILSYKRLLSRNRFKIFENIPFIHKILIIKNSNESTFNRKDFETFPIPIKVLHQSRNSMNNRYVPYDEIETKSVFSIDDDFNYLTDDFIVKTFFVWKLFPTSLVGVMERSHSGSSYVSMPYYYFHQSPKYSMVLQIFINKSFYRKYSFSMDPRIRKWVDLTTNCDDIAINFLVANITGQPPRLVTSPDFPRYSYGSSEFALSGRENHYTSRSRCISYFSSVSIFFLLPVIIVFVLDLWKESFGLQS